MAGVANVLYKKQFKKQIFSKLNSPNNHRNSLIEV